MTTATRGNIFPVYLIADESPSMQGSRISNLNAGLRSLLDEMHKHPLEAAKIRFSIIGFADDACTELALCDLRDLHEVPTLSVRGAKTRYSAAFDATRERIQEDVVSIRKQGYGALRPAAFFLTDGEPTEATENWMTSLQRLTDSNWRAHPNILAFGIAEAATDESAETIRKIATLVDYAYVAAESHDTGGALTKFLTALTHTMVATAEGLAQGKAEVMTEQPEGYIRIKADLV
ncbi:vWA domain-containing protein [Streptomyces alanosinicus]|uniref:VWFA domain-containing protein n=1 Tax=Streptomyces alanosinicus TaxID=68171 RepID=A0A918YQP4_9ACTN|nr:VWA domain-containing protein [Streptomyces alanosinicus]GHE11473.1 hypothetical protein GCM10010339_71480 [Streptomyces alanosinicus]